MATKQQATAAVEHENAGQWAGDVADAILGRESAARDIRAEGLSAAARLRAGVEHDGLMFFQRVEAEMRAAATAFNRRIGRIVLEVSPSPNGRLFVMSARSIDGAGFLSLSPRLSTEDRAPVPGVIVTERRHGRESVTPYDLALAEGDDLRMHVAGALLSPETFAARILSPWLETIALGGR